ncbi:MAG: hypothetical protein GY737_32690, partial [Desulfobacteraceae bacterium]|nr:hypothetical protein [Desulfobacteraceae bacterium]
MAAVRYLTWLATERGITIQHAGNGDEVAIGKYRVDGYCADTNTIFEYHGCYWHGHACYANSKTRKMTIGTTGETLEQAFQRTMQRQRELEHQGYTVEAVWECEVQKRLRADCKMAAAIEEIDVVMPIDPREAFFGGRVNATKLFHSCSEDERIRYLDICSLYPWTNKYCRYPIGHPSVITRDFKSLDSYFGLA